MKDDVPTMTSAGGYASWKKAITFWEYATEVTKDKQGFKVALSLTGRAREIAFMTPTDELAKETGLKTLLNALDKVYLGSKVESIFAAVENLEEFKRAKDMSISNYIMEFIRLKDIVFAETDEKEATQDSILAFRLLKQANLTPTEQQLVRATITALTFENMVNTLKKIYGERFLPVGEAQADTSCARTPAVKIKEEVFHQYEPTYNEYDYEEYQDYPVEEYDQEEEVLYTANGQPYRRTNYYAGRGRSNFRHRGTNKRPPRNEGFSEGPRDQNDRQRYNRRDPDTGFYTKCSTCKSVMHYFKDCPHKSMSNSAITMAVEEILEEVPDIMSINNDEDIVYLMGQTVNKAILDTGATTTVCGEDWLKLYEESLTKEEVQELDYQKEEKFFRFGDGKVVKSTDSVTLSTNICGIPARIKSHIVHCKIPLLISRAAMKKVKLKIDFGIDEISIGDATQKLFTTANGHITIDIGRSEENMSTSTCRNQNNVIQEVMLTTDDSPTKTATHLHKYFGHASGQKIGSVIKDSDLEKKEEVLKELKKLDETCEFCLKHKRSAPHQKVGLPLGKGFNSVVAMDLKFIGNGIILHMIDTVTRFSVACVVKDKNPESVIRGMFVHWIAIVGRSDHYLTDNGGEFVNAKLLSMCENLEVKLLTTAAYAPWMNGIVESHNRVLGEMIEKIMEDTKVSLEIATCWAVNAKNSLCMIYGFSPYQLVFGRNPNIPNVLESKSPTYLNETTNCKLVSDHLNALYSARQAFTHAENSHRLKRVLKEKIYPAANARFISGDSVYYKRDKSWLGPATVIGQDGKQVLLKNGGFIVKAHPSKVVLRATAITQLDSKASAASLEQVPQVQDVDRRRRRNIIDPQQWSIPDDLSEDKQPRSQMSIALPIPQLSAKESEAMPPLEEQTPIYEEDNTESDAETLQQNTPIHNEIEDVVQPPEIPTPQVISDVAIPVNHPQVQEWKKLTKNAKGTIQLKKGDMIRFKTVPDDEWKLAMIDIRAGKLHGVRQNEFNIHIDNEPDQCIPADKVEDIEKAHYVKCDESVITNAIIEPTNDSDVILINVCKKDDSPGIKEAQIREMTKWKEFNVYTEVKDIGQPTISTRWVISKKGDDFKARLVARGFEEMLEAPKDAPTADKSSVRLFLTLSACNHWEIETIDIKSAFLQSHDIERDVFLKPPQVVRTPGVLWKIHKPIYGLDDAAKLWYNTVKDELIASGCKMLILDHSVFSFYDEKTQKLIGMMVIHVDDFLYGGSTKFKKIIVQKIIDKYQISKQSSQSFVYLGWNIVQDKDGISMDQRQYCKTILPVLPLPKKDDNEPLSDEEKTSYQGLLGKLNWLACQSRPDLKYDVLEHSCYNQNPSVSNLKSLNKVTKRLVDGPQIIRFPKLDLTKSQLEIIVWTDASLGKLPKEGSGRGYIVFLKSGMTFSPLAWHSNKISKVCVSIFAAETMAFNDGVAEALLMRQTVSELLYQTPRDDIIPIICIMDSNQLHQHLQGSTQTSDKRIRLEVALLKEDIDKSNVTGIFLVRSEYNLADCLTKKGRVASCDKLCELLETGQMEREYWDESLMSQIMTVEYWENTDLFNQITESNVVID